MESFRWQASRVGLRTPAGSMCAGLRKGTFVLFKENMQAAAGTIEETKT